MIFDVCSTRFKRIHSLIIYTKRVPINEPQLGLSRTESNCSYHHLAQASASEIIKLSGDIADLSRILYSIQDKVGD